MSVVAQQGDNVTLVCTARAVDFFDVIRLTLTPSSDHGAESTHHQRRQQQQERWTIADNDVIKPPFLALPRYGVTMTTHGRRAVVELTLNGLYYDTSCLQKTMQGCFCQNFVQIFFTNYENFLPKNGKKENMQGALIFHVIYFASTHYRVKRSASHVISSFLAIFVPKKSSFAKI